MHHVQGSVLTLGGDPFETAAEHSDTVAQKRAVSRIVNVAFHDTGVSAKLTSVCYALLTRQAHHPLINLFGDLRSQQRKVRQKVVKSGVTSASKRVNRRYTKLLRSSRYRSRKLQPFRCFMTQQRSTRSGGMPGRPVRAEAGERAARHCWTKSTKADPPRVDRRDRANHPSAVQLAWPEGNRRARIGGR